MLGKTSVFCILILAFAYQCEEVAANGEEDDYEEDTVSTITEISHYDAPYQAAIVGKQENDEYFQSAAVITRSCVLTLGSVLKLRFEKNNNSYYDYWVVVFDNLLKLNNENEFTIKEVMYHPTINPDMNYLLTLIKVNNKMGMVYSIPLAYSRPSPQTFCSITGFGSRKHGRSFEDVRDTLKSTGLELRSTFLQVNESCPFKDPRLFCTKDYPLLPLPGDIGAPVVSLGRLVGLSYKHDSATGLNIHVAVGEFREWVMETARRKKYQSKGTPPSRFFPPGPTDASGSAPAFPPLDCLFLLAVLACTSKHSASYH